MTASSYSQPQADCSVRPSLEHQEHSPSCEETRLRSSLPREAVFPSSLHSSRSRSELAVPEAARRLAVLAQLLALVPMPRDARAEPHASL
jgi:hypothetical protein